MVTFCVFHMFLVNSRAFVMFLVNYRNSTALVFLQSVRVLYFPCDLLKFLDLYLKKSLAHVTTCFNLFKDYFKQRIKGHIHVLVYQEDLSCREIDWEKYYLPRAPLYKLLTKKALEPYKGLSSPLKWHQFLSRRISNIIKRRGITCQRFLLPTLVPLHDRRRGLFAIVVCSQGSCVIQKS